MKKKSLLFVFLTVSTVGMAQEVDYFEVGPYEVIYRGFGDFDARLRKDIDLLDYFDIKKDTIFVQKEVYPDFEPITTAWQAGAELTRKLWGFGYEATEASFWGSYKYQVSDGIYLNGGVSLAYQYNKCANVKIDNRSKEVDASIFEIGVPLSVEFADIRQNCSAPFVMVGLTPTYSTTLSQKIASSDNDLGGSSAVRIDPRFEFGTYFPFANKLCRIGLFIKKGLVLSESNPDGKDLIYGSRTSRVSIGGNISILF